MGKAIGGLWKDVQKRETAVNSEQKAGGRGVLGDLIEPRCGTLLATVPPLRGRRAADGAIDKTGHYSRDDRKEKSKCKSTA
jgi:hypothetical protein